MSTIRAPSEVRSVEWSTRCASSLEIVPLASAAVRQFKPRVPERCPLPPSPDSVIETIRSAFPPRPIDFATATADGLDNGAYRLHVDGKTWESLDSAYLVKRNDALSFLDAAHVAAVLPVYLLSLVTDGTRSPVPDTLLLVLDRRSETRFAELFEALSNDQRAAVVAALDAFAAAEEGPSAEAACAASARWGEHMSKKGRV